MASKFIPRPYQTDICARGSKILLEHKLLILSMMVRTGKTLSSMMIADNLGFKHVLFITKLKIIKSKTIDNDYELLNPKFKLTLVNYEQVHKINDDTIDLIIIDEIHSLGKLGKPSLRAKRIKEIVGFKHMIGMSGTISPESYSQIFPQLHVSKNSPFKEYKNFYQWAKHYVNIKQKRISYGRMVNDYSEANYDMIKKKLDPIMISLTQEEAGFASNITEHFLIVEMKKSTHNLIKILIKDNIYKDLIVCDTPASLQSKVQQLCSGTVIIEGGEKKIIDHSKAEFIKKRFKGKKWGCFYKFKAEFQMLKDIFGDDLTEDIHEFNETDKNIALQISSGREGISLKKADALIMLTVDFAAVSYQQALHRMGAIDRASSDIYWLFSDFKLEEKAYAKVKNKEPYTSAHFKKDFC